MQLKHVLFLFLVVMPLIAHAKWQRVASDDTGMTVSYIDISTIRKEGSIVKAWVLLDLKTPSFSDGKPYLSSKVQFSFYCATEAYAYLYVGHYARGMGSGIMVFSGRGTGNTYPIIPESLMSRVFSVACYPNR